MYTPSRSMGPATWGIEMNLLRRNVLIVIVVVLVVFGETLAVLQAKASCDPSLSPCGQIIAQRIGIGILLIAATFVGKTAEAWASGRDRANTAKDQLGKDLATDVQSLFEEKYQPFVRANIMLVEKEKLRIFAAHNMKDERERQSLEFKKGVGACGVAWELASTKPASERWRPVYAVNLHGTDVLKWGLTPLQIDMTKRIRWIISAPILSQALEPVGILNIDALGETPDPLEIAKPAFRTDEKLFSAVASAASKYANELASFRIV